MADWEPGYAVAGLRHWAKVPVRTVGFTRGPITTMGGLRLLPDIALAELPTGADAVRLFLLPGGDLWEGEYPSSSLEPVLKALPGAWAISFLPADIVGFPSRFFINPPRPGGP